MTTNELAAKIGLRSTSIHHRFCTTGSYFGIRPTKMPNGRLFWPDDTFERLASRQERGQK